MDREPLTAERLRGLLSYDPVTGVFTWLVGTRKIKVGAVAGAINNGYRIITIDGQKFRAARLAVLWMTGDLPAHEVDHDNRKRSDDRWLNLKPATRCENMQNRSLTKSNTSGHVGVGRRGKRWRAHIRADGTLHHLGYFATEGDAMLAYQTAKERLHPFHPEVA